MLNHNNHVQNDICVIGLGYVGLPMAAMFANTGLRVFGADIDTNKIQKLKSVESKFDEPGLEQLLRNVIIKQNSLSIGLKPMSSQVYIICVPTPHHEETNEPDLTYLNDAIKQISEIVEPNQIIVIESTSPVGTSEKMISLLREILSREREWSQDKINSIGFAYCPERVLPGNAIFEIAHNSRIIGANCDATLVSVEKLYKRIVKGEFSKFSNLKSAELCKLAENSFRDVNIAFANEIDMLCRKYQLSTQDIIEACNKHPRVNILNPGIGVGGHCIPVDPWFLIYENENETKLISQARNSNIMKETFVLHLLEKSLAKLIEQNTQVVFLGLAYKENVDDFRNSPAFNIYKQLFKRFPKHVNAIDPLHSVDTKMNINTISVEEAVDLQYNFIKLVNHDSFNDYKIPDNFTLEI